MRREATKLLAGYMKPQADGARCRSARKCSLTATAIVAAVVLVAAGCGGVGGSGGGDSDVDSGVAATDQTTATTVSVTTIVEEPVRTVAVSPPPTAAMELPATTAAAEPAEPVATTIPGWWPKPTGAKVLVNGKCPEEPVEWASPSRLRRVEEMLANQAEHRANNPGSIEDWAVDSSASEAPRPSPNWVAEAGDVVALLEFEGKLCLEHLRIQSDVLVGSVAKLGDVLENLVRLRVYGGEVTVLPDELFDHLPKLESLSLVIPWLEVLPERLRELENLTRLEVDGGPALQTLPDWLHEMNLTSLNIY